LAEGIQNGTNSLKKRKSISEGSRNVLCNHRAKKHKKNFNRREEYVLPRGKGRASR